MTDKIELVIVAIISLLIMLPFTFTGIANFHFLFDEGGSLIITRNIMQGKLPYVDFHFIYTPLMYYINAFFMMVSNTIITHRIVMLLFAVLGVIGVHRLSSMLIDGKARFIPPIMYALYIIPIFNIPEPSVLANTLLIFATIYLLKGKQFHSGILLALCFLTKQNIGIYAIFAFSLFMLLNKNLKGLFRLGISVSLGLLPYVIYLLISHSLVGFVSDVFLMPLKYPGMIKPVSMTEPFLNFQLTALNIAQIGLRVLFLAPILLYLVIFPRALKQKSLLLVLLVCAGNYLQFFPTKEVVHFAWGFAPSFILLGYQLKKSSKIVALFLLGYVLLAFYCILLFQTSPLVNTRQIGVKGTELLFVQPQAAELLHSAVGKIGNDTFLVYGSGEILYYLTGQGRPMALDMGYSVGNYKIEEQQKEIINYLNSTRPKYAIISTKLMPSDYQLVQEYILQNYEYDETIDNPYTPLAFYRIR